MDGWSQTWDRGLLRGERRLDPPPDLEVCSIDGLTLSLRSIPNRLHLLPEKHQSRAAGWGCPGRRRCESSTRLQNDAV
uniref:Uncharacterized protein n=1 Tax=Salarias fasciatus TaxID=181472 RepID=A0A672H5T7_SALFA